LLTLREADEALRLATIVELADGRRRIGHNLGFALINYGRLFVRDYWTLFAIARELDCGVGDLVSPPDRAEKRSKWDELTRASEAVLAVVRTLPDPLRWICERRASGQSWRKIARSRPDRLLFSMQDDYEESLGILLIRAGEPLSFLCSAENFIVVKRRARA
jgi:hypothetical protein